MAKFAKQIIKRNEKRVSIKKGGKKKIPHRLMKIEKKKD